MKLFQNRKFKRFIIQKRRIPRGTSGVLCEVALTTQKHEAKVLREIVKND